MNSIILLLLGINIAPALSEFEIFDGQCPLADVDYIQNFDQVKFTGFWYVIERYEISNFTHCARFNYFWSEDDRKLESRLRQIELVPPGATTMYVQSNMWELEKFSNNGKYLHWVKLFRREQYRYVDTDYENYAVLWICFQNGTVNEQNLIVMARDINFDINSSESLNATLSKPPFDRRLLKKIDHQHRLCD